MVSSATLEQLPSSNSDLYSILASQPKDEFYSDLDFVIRGKSLS